MQVSRGFRGARFGLCLLGVWMASGLAVAQRIEPMDPAPADEATMRHHSQQAVHGSEVLKDLRNRDRLLWQRATARLSEAAVGVETAIAEGRFEEARLLAERALQAIEAARIYADPASDYESAKRSAQELIDRVRREFGEYSVRAADDQRQQIAEMLERRQVEQDQLRREKIDQFFSTARKLGDERRYSEAAQAMRQVLAIDPSNDTARFALEQYEQFSAIYEQIEIGDAAMRERRKVFNRAEEALIPWHNDILYPKNWLELSARRDGIEAGAGQLEEDIELNRKLEDVQPDIGFIDQPFEQVVEFLIDINKMNIAVDWENLAENAIDRDKPITINLRNVKLRTALQEILSQVGGDVRLAYAIGDGLLRIATKEKLDRDKFILVYDIRDLVVEIRRFTNSPRIDLTQQVQGGGGGGGQGIFGGAGGGQDDDEQEDQDNPLIEEILDIIRQMVEPDSWRETAGGTGALRELNGQLIVFNTSDAHRQIRDLLGQLRLQRALMIGVESRFLTVTSNFLEEMGVDLDFVFNSGNAGFDRAFNNQGQGVFDPFTGAPVLIPRQLSRIGSVPAVPGFGGGQMGSTIPAQPYTNPGLVPARGGVIPSSGYITPLPVNQGSLGLVDPTQLNTGIPGSIAQSANFGPALNIAGSFLDNLQVDFLIRATQANRRSSIVQAPRLMMFNGQRAWVALTRDRGYVGTVNAQVAEGAVAVQPVVETIASGSSLDVDGTISADRKYVTLTVRVGFAGEPTLERFEVQRASGNSPGIFVTLTDQERQAINTSVTIPDGGTVLIGGLKQVAEVEMTAGVPILSKIPVLKRAFTNTSSVRDTQTLLILMKAKVIIPSEAEEEAFPSFSRG